MEQSNKRARFVMVINYYTGEKWYLVERDGKEMYVSEAELDAVDTCGHETKMQEVPEE